MGGLTTVLKRTCRHGHACPCLHLQQCSAIRSICRVMLCDWPYFVDQGSPYCNTERCTTLVWVQIVILPKLRSFVQMLIFGYTQ